MGAILATRIYQRGAAGVVTDGAFRDSPVIAEIGIPAYAVAMNANTNKTIHHPSEIQVPIACGGVAVVPNDSIKEKKKKQQKKNKRKEKKAEKKRKKKKENKKK